MFGVAPTLRSWLLATAVLVVCACIVLSASSAEAMTCQIEQVAPEEEPLSSSPMVVRDQASLLAEFRAPAPEPGWSCSDLSTEECRWDFPDGAPEPTRRLPLRTHVAALMASSMSLATPTLIACARRSDDGGQASAYRARVFRPPRLP